MSGRDFSGSINKCIPLETVIIVATTNSELEVIACH